MIKIINGIFSFLKVILLLVSFVFSFFIIINMYRRLEKDMFDAIYNFIPFITLFILFAINFIFKQKSVNGCLFYNITSCLVFSMILVAVLRTFLDENMVVMLRLGYGINFNYFADIIAPMRAMLYVLCISNVLLMIDGYDFKINKKKKVNEEIEINEKVKTDEKIKVNKKIKTNEEVKVNKKVKEAEKEKTNGKTKIKKKVVSML